MRGSAKWPFVAGLILFGLVFIGLGIWALRTVGWQPKLMGDGWWPRETVLALEVPHLSAWIRAMEASPSMRDVRRPGVGPQMDAYFRAVQDRVDARLPVSWQKRIDEWVARGTLHQIRRVAAAVWLHAPADCRRDGVWEWAWMVEAPPEVWTLIEPTLRGFWQEWARALGRTAPPVVHTEGYRHFLTSDRGWTDLQDVRAGRRPALRGTPAASVWRRQVRSPGLYVLLVPGVWAACPPADVRAKSFGRVLHRLRAVVLGTGIRGGWQDIVLEVVPEGPWPPPWDRLVTKTSLRKEFLRWVRDEDRIVAALHVEEPAEWLRWLRSLRDGLEVPDLLDDWSGDLLVTADLSRLWPQWPSITASARSPGQGEPDLATLAQVLQSLGQARLKVVVGTRDAARWGQALQTWVERTQREQWAVAVRRVQDRPFPLYQASVLLLPTVSPTFGVHPLGFVLTLHGAQMEEILKDHGPAKGGLLKGKPRWRALDTFGPDRWLLFLYMDGPSLLTLERPWELRRLVLPVGTSPRGLDLPPLPDSLWQDLLRRAEAWQGQLTKVWCGPEACTLQTRSDVVFLPPLPTLLRLTALALRDAPRVWRAGDGGGP